MPDNIEIQYENYKLALVYANKGLSSLEYSDPPLYVTTGAVEYLNPAIYNDYELESVSSAGSTLSGRRYKTIRWIYRNHNITIASDELNEVNDLNGVGNTGESGKSFFRNFFASDFKYITVKNNLTGEYSDFRQVIVADDTLGLSFLEDLEIYPQVTLKLSETKPITKGTGGYGL